MRIKAYNASQDMEFKNKDFESQVERDEENTKVEEGVDKSPLVNENVHTSLECYRTFVFKHVNRSLQC